MRDEEEFGEPRLIQEAERLPRPVAERIVSTVLATVQAFSRGTQSDDLTLLIAKARA